MKKLLTLFTAIILCSCNDGDVIVDNFEFENIDVEACDPLISGSTFNYTFYKLDRTNNESISLDLSVTADLFTQNGTYGPYTLGSTNTIEYRRFDGQPATDYYCNNIPSTTPQVLERYFSTGGEVTFTTTTEFEDDNDGIPAELEKDNGVERDTDGDGIPDHLDADDDGDNVLTVNESVVIIDGAISTMSNDEDGDGIYDYLDADDDGDMIPTIQEDLDGNLDPSNDLSMNGIPAYLDNTATLTASPAITAYRVNVYNRQARVVISVENMTLMSNDNEIILQTYNFGTYVSSLFTVTE